MALTIGAHQPSAADPQTDITDGQSRAPSKQATWRRLAFCSAHEQGLLQLHGA